MLTTERTRVRMLAHIAGADMPGYGIEGVWSYKRGDTPHLHPQLAKAWIASGDAERCNEDKKEEKKAK